jgi:hypothetical protein
MLAAASYVCLEGAFLGFVRLQLLQTATQPGDAPVH